VGFASIVDAAYVREQRDQLMVVAKLGRLVTDGAIGEDEAVRQSPFNASATRTAIARVKAELRRMHSLDHFADRGRTHERA